MIRHFMAVSILAFWLLVFVPLFTGGRSYGRPRGPSGTAGQRVVEARGTSAKVAALVPLAAVVVASGYFLVDALRRSYRGEHLSAIALAVVGVISGGLTSLVYYAIWGRYPLEREHEVLGSDFCAACVAGSTDRPAPGTAVHDLFLGTRLMGAADRCPACNSVVKTLWVWVFVPLVPVGSYRILAVGDGRYVGRRLPALDLRQVIGVFAVTVGVVFAIVAVAWLANR